MGLEHFEWEVGDVIVLHLSGSITLGDGTRKFRKLVRDTLDSGKKNILLNMSEVVYLDSSGLGELVAAYTTSKNNGGTLKLMKLTQRVQELDDPVFTWHGVDGELGRATLEPSVKLDGAR